MSGTPIRAKYRHFRTICEQTVDNSPTDPISSFFWWSSRHGVCDVVYLLRCFIRQLSISLHSFLCMTFHITAPSGNVCAKFLRIRLLFFRSCRDFGIQTYFYNCPQYLCFLDSLVEYNPDRHGQGMMSGLPKSTSFTSIFHIGSMFCFFPSQFYIIHIHRQESPFS